MTACSIIPSEITFTSQTKGIAVDGCPAVKAYTPEQNAQAAAELDRLGPTAVLQIYMADYRGLRAQVRACRETAVPGS